MSAQNCGGREQELVEGQDKTGRDERGRAKGYYFFHLSRIGVFELKKKNSWLLVVKQLHEENAMTADEIQSTRKL